MENSDDSGLYLSVTSDLQCSGTANLVSTAAQAVCASKDVACETASLPSLQKPILSIAKFAPLSIQPREIYHPAIINVCQAMCDKHPSQLSNEETEKFNFYLERKCMMG